jgi:hypothetical protein
MLSHMLTAEWLGTRLSCRPFSKLSLLLSLPMRGGEGGGGGGAKPYESKRAWSFKNHSILSGALLVGVTKIPQLVLVLVLVTKLRKKGVGLYSDYYPHSSISLCLLVNYADVTYHYYLSCIILYII